MRQMEPEMSGAKSHDTPSAARDSGPPGGAVPAAGRPSRNSAGTEGQDAASVDRFACRREGHVPALKFTALRATGMPAPETYITTCARCGKSVEFKVGEAGEEAERDV